MPAQQQQSELPVSLVQKTSQKIYRELSKFQLTRDKIYASIQSQKDYEHISNASIQLERQLLVGYLKTLNVHLETCISHSSNLKSISKQLKKCRVKKRKKKLPSLTPQDQIQQDQSNMRLINILNNEKDFLAKKLQRLTDSESSLKCADELLLVRQSIKQQTAKISNLKKQIYLNKQKLLKAGKQKPRNQFNQLQMQYLQCKKKQDQLTQKISLAQDKFTDAMCRSDQCDFSQLQHLIDSITKQKISKETEGHLSDLYSLRLKKLKLETKRAQRQHEVLSQQYFRLLLQYEDSTTKVQQQDQAINSVQKAVQQACTTIKQLIELSEISNGVVKKQIKLESQQEIQEADFSHFMITEPCESNTTKRISPKKTLGLPKAQIMPASYFGCIKRNHPAGKIKHHSEDKKPKRIWELAASKIKSLSKERRVKESNIIKNYIQEFSEEAITAEEIE